MKNIEFINAGAGSGKTHTLVHLLADYLGGKKGVPDQEEDRGGDPTARLSSGRSHFPRFRCLIRMRS